MIAANAFSEPFNGWKKTIRIRQGSRWQIVNGFPSMFCTHECSAKKKQQQHKTNLYRASLDQLATILVTFFLCCAISFSQTSVPSVYIHTNVPCDQKYIKFLYIFFRFVVRVSACLRVSAFGRLSNTNANLLMCRTDEAI